MSEYYDITVEQGQDIFDIAIQEYGGVDALFVVLEDNASIDLTTELQAGDVLSIRREPASTLISDPQSLAWFRARQVRVRNQGLAGEAEIPIPTSAFTEGFTIGFES